MEFVKENWKMVAVAAASGALVATAVGHFKESKNKSVNSLPRKWIKVGTVKELVLYPVKSCKAVNVEEAICTQIGLKASKYLRDRIFMVADNKGSPRTLRQLPKMALIEMTVNDLENKVSLSAPGMDSIDFVPPKDYPEIIRSCRVFNDRVPDVLDCGDPIAQWISKFLETDDLRLLYHFMDTSKRVMSSWDKKFALFTPMDKGAFSDETAYMLMSDASVEELNKDLEKPVTYRNFRPNIVITGVVEPFAEDYWGYIRIGKNGPVFKSPKPCIRCKLTTVEPDKGVFDAKGEPLNSLRKLERKFGDKVIDDLTKKQGIMGITLGLVNGNNEKIHVGDPVYVALL